MKKVIFSNTPSNTVSIDDVLDSKMYIAQKMISRNIYLVVEAPFDVFSLVELDILMTYDSYRTFGSAKELINFHADAFDFYEVESVAEAINLIKEI